MEDVDHESVQSSSGSDCISAMCSANVLASGGHEPVLQDRFHFLSDLFPNMWILHFFLS